LGFDAGMMKRLGSSVIEERLEMIDLLT